MDKTANYNLPQWVGTDPIRMKPFNDAFDGIDKALKANADAAQALQSGKADAQTVSALAKNLGAAGLVEVDVRVDGPRQQDVGGPERDVGRRVGAWGDGCDDAVGDGERRGLDAVAEGGALG